MTTLPSFMANSSFVTRTKMAMATLMMLTFTGTALAQAPAQKVSYSDAQQIRNLVEQQNKDVNQPVIKRTSEAIFWSGAFPSPLIGKQLSPQDQAIRDKMKKERHNYQATSRIERLVVAQSGDIAYEYGNGTLEWDTPEKKHIKFDNAYLRTWKKVNGEWQADAFFARPLNTRMIRVNSTSK